jgi:hypothetical protein
MRPRNYKDGGSDFFSSHRPLLINPQGGTVMIPKNAYYLQVQRLKRSMKPKAVVWRSKHTVRADQFQVVKK